MMDTMSVSDARAKLPSLINHISRGVNRVIITVHGQPKAVVISPEELESIEETAEILSIPGTHQSIRRGMKQIKRGDVIPLSKLDETS